MRLARRAADVHDDATVDLVSDGLVRVWPSVGRCGHLEIGTGETQLREGVGFELLAASIVPIEPHFERHGTGKGPETLRCCRWKGGTLVLGQVEPTPHIVGQRSPARRGE